MKSGDFNHCHKFEGSEAPTKNDAFKYNTLECIHRDMGDEVILTITESTNYNSKIQITKEHFVTAQQ